MKLMLAVILVCLATTSAHAKIRTEVMEYQQGGATLAGYLAYDDAVAGKRPGVLVVHEWKGLGPYEQRRARELAALGYVAFAADIYGKGIRPQTTEQAAAESGKYRDNRALLRARTLAGLEALKGFEPTDPERTAAIGYCFGGTAVLELARSGAEVGGVVSFHGVLDTPRPEDAKQIRAKLLVLTGADDPYVTGEQVAAFEDEMRKAKVDWQMITYGGAVHSFTNPASGDDPSKGAAYNEKADKRSWQAMKQFFAEILE